MGESGSGKDTVAHICEDKYCMKPVCSYTTRPLRPNEVNGREHWFVNDAKMEELKASGTIVAYVYMKDKNSTAKGYEYCATVDNLKKADMYIIDPLGFKNMVDNGYGDAFDITRIHIYAPYEVRRERAIKRGIKNIQDFDDRYANEHIQFEAARTERDYDYFINNENISLDELSKQVENILLKEGYLTFGRKVKMFFKKIFKK